MEKNMSLASEIIREQQKEIIDLADLFKKALTIAPDDTLLELEKEWSEVKTPVGRSVMKFIKEEQEQRKVDRGWEGIKWQKSGKMQKVEF